MTGSSSRRAARTRPKPSSVDSASPDPDSLYKQKPIARTRKERTGTDHSSIRMMEVDLKALLGFGIIAFAIVVLVIYRHASYTEGGGRDSQRSRVVTPLPAPKMMDLPQFQGEHKESLYWGTYRPLVYLGIRARTPQSLIAGLMWIGIKNGQYFMRHVCQDSDELSTYGWTHHNGRDYGHQVLVDQDLTLTTSFLKAKMNGSGYGGDWAVRVDAQNEKSGLDDETWRAAHLFFYLADEEGNALRIGSEGSVIHGDTLLAFGSREDVGGWELHLDSSDKLEIHYSGFRSRHMHNLTELVQQTLGVHARRTGHLQLPDLSEHSPNIVVFQISAKLPFKMDIAFVSGTGSKSSRAEERVNRLTGVLLTNQLNEKQKDFEDKYMQCFNLTNKVNSESMVVGRAAIGNLLGGIGYFYGQSKIALSKDSNLENSNEYVSYWPAALYSAVPSRSLFPRGFLWDEGFHQLLIWRWDIGICLDIIGHWLDLMNVDGWIPREQILGAEALSKVPEEFVPQLPTNGNPPTLFLVLHELVRGSKSNKFTVRESEQISAFLNRAFVRLEAWFKWFNTTQAGKEAGTFYWHGRDNVTARELNPKTLSSGLDDYPRASHPSEDERHLDLRCWMLLAADCMHSIVELLGMKDGLDKGYYSMAKQLSDFEVLNQMHLDEVTGAYFDFGNHTEKVRLRWHEVKVSGGNHANRVLLREVAEKPQLRLVPHVGYVSLFPFMMRVIPPASGILEKQLDLIFNQSTLWTSYGIRSLSKTSSLYMKRNTEHDPPYWRGPIWINMNYMILSALHHYSQEEGPYKVKASGIYKELRKNIIGNVVHNYFQTGYLWEQYEEKNKGKGKGGRPFTGWTSLVLLMMAEAY
ncbi:mannosyl-oligosaccharide glucosidase GCS1 [Magnolia sinica]|uniref:mannosyl-oligosaccharide glucosidase GCS1 n=1 Tax=Magnolia sinica TaxID=86752 RepID=UPI00265AA074|nr:mannosyl-oligosaccharide glucosidase GCS1 [Magnolia sinica]